MLIVFYRVLLRMPTDEYRANQKWPGGSYTEIAPIIRILVTNNVTTSVRAKFADVYLRGMRDRSMRSGTELAREIHPTDWPTAGEQVKPV